LAPRPLPSLFPAPSDLPALLTHPNFPGLPGEGLRAFPDGTPPPLPLGGALPLLLKDRAAGPPRGPLTTLSHSQGPQRRVEFPRWGSFVPPHMCSFSHCDFALLPTQSRVGEELPRKHGLSQVLSPFLLLGTAAGRRGTGCSLPQPLSFPLSPVPRRPGCLLHREPAPLSSGLGGPPPPWENVSGLSRPPLLGPKPSGPELCKATGPLRLQDSACGGRSTSVSARLAATRQSGSRPVGVSGRAPGERSPSWFLWCENSSFPSIAKRRKPTHPPAGVPGRGKGGVVVELVGLMLGPAACWGEGGGRLRGSRPILSPQICALGCRGGHQTTLCHPHWGASLAPGLPLANLRPP